VLVGYYNYYRIANDLSRFNRIEYYLKYSAAHTLAAKYKLSIAKVFEKYGNNLTAKTTSDKTISLTNYKKSINSVSGSYDPLLTTR
jgi:hypothetical protein